MAFTDDINSDLSKAAARVLRRNLHEGKLPDMAGDIRNDIKDIMDSMKTLIRDIKDEAKELDRKADQLLKADDSDATFTKVEVIEDQRDILEDWADTLQNAMTWLVDIGKR